MSEIEGYVLAHSSDEQVFNKIVEEFKKGYTLELGDDKYQVWDVKTDSILDLYFYTNEYSDTAELSSYIQEKYSPEILISSFDKKALIDGKKVNRKKAFTALSTLSPKIGFYLNIEYGKYKQAYKILCDGSIDLSDVFSGVPNFERCFFGDYAPLMEYAVDRGYHDHYCQYDENFPFDEDGVHVLHRLIKSSNLELIEKALKLGASPNGIDGDKGTLLHNIGWYAFSDEFTFDVLDLISLLASYGADLNARDWEGYTPMQTLYGNVENHLEDHQHDIENIIEEFIKCGASVDVFDNSGAGLLTYYKGVDNIEAILLQANPDLKPATDNFDINSCILEQSCIRDDNLPRDYDRYFCECIKYGFIDFLLEEKQVSIINTLTHEQLYQILLEAFSSPYAVKILQGFFANDIPIIIEQNIEDGAEEVQEIEIVDCKNNNELIDFYNKLHARPHKKLVINYSNEFHLLNNLKIVDAC